MDSLKGFSIEPKEIGSIDNHCGGLFVAKIGDRFGWLIENYDTHFADPSEYEIIPKYLYDALIKFERDRESSKQEI